MTDTITKGIELAQVVSPSVETQIVTWQFLVANAFTIVGGAFATLFMILIFFIFVKALLGSDLRDLFKGEIKNELSMTKFWTNVAYFSATIAFLASNLIGGAKGEGPDEMIWLIYLGTVGSTAVASKWLAMKYDTKSLVQESTVTIQATKTGPSES